MTTQHLEADQLPRGLYTPQLESDACGTGFIANLNGTPSHQLVEDALKMLACMEHRGACGYEANTGDGAGIMIQTPHEFFKKKAKENGFELPEFGEYGVGCVFFPADKALRNQCRTLLNDYIDEMEFDLLGYRLVPTDDELLGETATSVQPRMEHVFVKPRQTPPDRYWLERRLYVLRKYSTHRIHQTFPQTQDHFYIASFSYKTVLYKGQLTTWQLRPYFPDLHNEDLKSAIALFHSRFSTNTFPKWKLAQPFRYIAHNGEINTIMGNINWWKSKEFIMESTQFTADELEKLFPVCGQALSDSANFDNVLEFLVLNGRSLPHALMMMIPEAWQHDEQMAQYKKAFYEYHETMMEPWDGPAGICFSDGILVGATLDRNGLRPLRWVLTDDNVLITASEAGILEIPQDKVVRKGRLQPGKMLIADLDEHRIIDDAEVKERICQNKDYQSWLTKHKASLSNLPDTEGVTDADILSQDEKSLTEKQQLFNFTKEDLKVLIQPMAKTGEEAIGSMGADTPLAILSQRTQHLSSYFKQLFAQVTNPPIDPIRERAVMSLHVKLGSGENILIPTENSARFIGLEQPVLKNLDLLKLKNIVLPHFKSEIIDITFDSEGQKGRLQAAIDHICSESENAVRNGTNLLILSDREADILNAPIPSLLAAGAVHHHLVKNGLRSMCSIIVEAGDIWETHHFATLIGYGVQAINPYMAFATIKNLIDTEGAAEHNGHSVDYAIEKYIKAIGKGLLKVMSKIGISTLQSYAGAQIFEILGLHSSVVNKCFTKSVSRIEGIGFDGIAEEVLTRHRVAYIETPLGLTKTLEEGGVYQWKRRGEAHTLNPNTIHLLQYSTATGNYETFKKYSKLINEQDKQALTLRGLMAFRKGQPVPIEEVEPVENILKRFATGAMSFGSISHEAHSTLAIAMNRIGGRSNSGEGGEDEIRYEIKENGDYERSAIKQVASGRFGVTSYYLSQADELQIKMAQGAKPGEGGQLPGHKVDDWIGRVRHSTPGVGLISPPPHHDIYSIEDLAQLIYDLKNANPKADINVKLVSKAGVGIIASGVAKAKADKILIAGYDGGTGASPLSSIRHAGLPWELGLAETHQVLVKNKLRDRVIVQTDGQLRTGRDIAIATMLGAEEWGIATAALLVEGCIMMRKCHLNTCPVGIATQDPELRKRFTGKPEHVINFFRFVAEELREIMAELGFRTVNEMVGKVEMLKFRKDVGHWKYKAIDLSPILYKEPADESLIQHKAIAQNHEIDHVLDRKLIDKATNTLETGKQYASVVKIKNTDRAVGAMLSYEISKRYKGVGLNDGTLVYRFKGSAGQSFGVFLTKGVTFILRGEANDYFGKGLSGGKLVVSPDDKATFDPSENSIIGNVALYGATSGEAYIKGMAGERFAVRNSGATAVVEGVGDHGCEYMTGGIAIVLGSTGRNFAAGMSGGIAYVYDPNKKFPANFNNDMADMEDMADEDFETVRRLVREHFRNTSSQKALGILDNWATAKADFVKVMPRDYKAVLEKRKKEVLALA
ncbi:MAG: glutamate synthase large subunit [Saprospiraceae bacterium]|nr:glutamate synthase large subunit [Saprospiraceae bacterium]